MKKSFLLVMVLVVGVSAIVGMALLRGKPKMSIEPTSIHPAVQHAPVSGDQGGDSATPSHTRAPASTSPVLATTQGQINPDMRANTPAAPSSSVSQAPQVSQSTRLPQSPLNTGTSGASSPSQSGGTFSTTFTTPLSNIPLQQAPPGSTTTLEAETPVWELPPGVKAPAAFYETGENGNPATVAANEQIAQSFEEEVLSESSSTSEGNTETSSGKWNAAVKRADELYRTLFGDAAYNSRGLQSAADAQSSLQTSGGTNGY